MYGKVCKGSARGWQGFRRGLGVAGSTFNRLWATCTARHRSRVPYWMTFVNPEGSGALPGAPHTAILRFPQTGLSPTSHHASYMQAYDFLEQKVGPTSLPEIRDHRDMRRLLVHVLGCPGTLHRRHIRGCSICQAGIVGEKGFGVFGKGKVPHAAKV